jgi:hypothetical protein
LEHPVDTNTWYVIEGTCPLGCYPSNLYKTTDGGKTRSDFGLNTLLTGTTTTYSAVNSFSAAGNPQYAATSKGIYQSTDVGKNWKALSNAGFPFESMNVLNVRSEGNVLYAETSAGTFVYGKDSPATVTNAEAVGNVAINSTVKIAAYGLFLKNQSLNLNLQDCTNPTLLNEGDDMTQFFQCQMGATAGVKTGQIKDSSGSALFNFNITVTAPVSQISGVTPLIAKVSETTTFKITGSNLPQNLQFSVQDCTPVQTVAPETCTTTQCQFACTPSSAGSKTGQIKENGGNVLFNFSVQVDAATNPITNNQCATFNPSAKPNVIIPCLSVNGQNYSAALNLMNAPTLRFEADMSLFKPITTSANADCGALPYQNKPVVHLNCVDVGGTKYWADLNLAPSNSGAIEFDLGGAGIR